MNNSAKSSKIENDKEMQNSAWEALSQDRLGAFHYDNIEVVMSDNLNAIEPIWYSLQQQCPYTIYQHFLWQKAWLETIGNDLKGKPLFITGSIDQKPVFLLPLIVIQKTGLKIATWIGGEHANYRFGLFAPHHNEAIRQIIPMLPSAISKHLPYSLDVLELTQQPLSWDGNNNPMAALPKQRSPLSGGSISLVPDFNAVLAIGNAKRKRKILRAQEKTIGALGGYEFLRTKNESEHNALYDVFIAQKKQWFADRGIKNKFSNDATTAFFNRLSRYNLYMDEGEFLLEFDYIYADGEHLSMLAGGTVKSQHFGYFTSMTNDSKYASVSPGSLNFYKRIEAACAENMRRFDFGVGAERYKKSWCNETHALIDIIIPISAKGRIYTAMRLLKSSVKRLLKENETFWPLVKSARRFIRGKSN